MITLLTGNSRVLLAVDEAGNWSQLYYPYAGQYQHVRETKLGLYDADNEEFAWLGSPGNGWRVEQEPVAHSNGAVTRHLGDGLTVEVTDMVHSNHDLIIRRIALKNGRDTTRRLRVFSYHSLTIAESMYQDTAYWDDERRTLNHYKRNYYFQLRGVPDFDAFTCGEHTLKGLQGSYVDAEDGKLEGGRISHGAADSVAQWNVTIPPSGEATVYLQVMLGHSRQEVNQFYAYLKGREVNGLAREATDFWAHWIRNKNLRVPTTLSEDAKRVYERSVFVLRNCSAGNGSIIASPDPRTLKSGGDTYNYNWWRDGGYISKAMDEVGLYDNAHRWLKFAMACQEQEGYFLHRHFPDGSVGSTWHPPPFIQIDQTATVISAAWHHFKRHGDLDELLGLWPLIKKGANFLERFVDPSMGLPLPSFDLWEEKKANFTYSTAAVYHGLERAERISEQLGKSLGRWRLSAESMRESALKHMWNPARKAFYKSLDPKEDTLDASTLLTIKLGLLPTTDPRAEDLVRTLENRLWVKDTGGLCRYENDHYYGHENPWLICTLWLAEAHLMLGRPERCRELIEWTARTASSTYLLPEQLDARTGQHTSVTPLVWSHSTFIDVVNKYARAIEGSEDGE
ncbi:MAG TPA: glycoside hydrolase family 15 protein [Candidatus Thermoplasmatota archaeon]|nr:glycoside hydrolase family 15 protein [Candidatus Thermoplasmatota archaeon]